MSTFAPLSMTIQLLPTPTVSESTGPGVHGTGGDNLRTVVDQLLPTPRATRGGSGTETLYGLGAERSDANRPQGEVLLPTPQAADGNGGGRRSSPGHATTLPGEVIDKLMPTPRATDGTKGGPNQRGSSGDLMLPSATALLPTPRTQNNENRQSEGYGGERGNYYGLIHGAQDWREYEAAIRRCELAWGRPAPLPTEPGAKGQPRLSPRFVEWLMGLPEGHVTDPAIGISRNDQLKALGNGVVPQQCAAALRAFLADSMTEAVAS